MEPENVVPMRKDTPLIMGTLAAHAGLFLVISLALAVSFSVVFVLTTAGFARFVEWQHPGSFETPLSGFAPLLAGGFTTVLLHIVVLAVLAYRRVRMMKFFLFLIGLIFVSLIAFLYIDIGVLQYFKGWYPIWKTPMCEYPVLVVTPDQRPGFYQAHVIQWADLPSFCRDNPQYSFLVPEGQDSNLLSQLPKHDFRWSGAQNIDPKDPISAQFSVIRLANARQKVIVSGSWYRNNNASVQSWYEAEAHKIYPKYVIEADTRRYYGYAILFLVGLVDMILLGFYLWRAWEKDPMAC